MRKSHCINRLIVLATLVASISFQSCKDDVFNPEIVKATYKDKFPVKDIDPQMDWKMTRQVAVNVSIHEDVDVNYTIRIYDQNPLLSQSSAKLLAEGTANNTTVFTTTIDCPNVLTEVFVCRIDPHNRNVVKYVSIENDQISTVFGSAPANTRASQTTDGGISIETYSPQLSESEVRDLLPNAIEIDNGTDFKNGGIYKISKNKTFKHKIFKGGLNGNNPAIILIEGTWAPTTTVNIQRGFELYVLNGGKIEIPDNHTISFVESSNFIVYAGGSIEGNNLTLTNSSYGKYNYNAGSMKIGKFHASSGGAFYNCGTAEIGIMAFTSGCKFINQGTAKIHQTDSNLLIENGCLLNVNELACTLYMGNNSAAKIIKFGDYSNYKTKVYMGNNSMITITEAKLSQAQFTGPEKQYALVKIEKIGDIVSFQSTGNIYYEVKEIDDKIMNNSWHKQFLKAIMNTNGTISKWGESPFTLPEGDCTGEGNKPTDSGTPTPTKPITYTYVYEDNFPLVGDYDFNDIVLDVNIEYNRGLDNKITTTRITVTLAAAGASKTVGAGLRIVGDKAPDAVAKVTYAGADKDRFLSSLQGSMFGTEPENDGTIPLFGDEHKVFGVPTGTLINTGEATAAPRTLEIIIDQKDAYQFDEPVITKDNLDFFIAYRYRAMKERVEVHLYEFWKYGATAAGTIQQANLDLAGNNTWAICVPGFGYPEERINISDQENKSNCAYPDFLGWARDRTKNQDWYLNPIKENLYRQPQE